MGCHCLLQCVKVKSESEDAQLCLTLSDPMDCSLPGSSVHGISQARVLEWVAIAFSKRRLSSEELMFSISQESSPVTVVLEKTLESPLDGKEIKPVNPKGNQP